MDRTKTFLTQLFIAICGYGVILLILAAVFGRAVLLKDWLWLAVFFIIINVDYLVDYRRGRESKEGSDA